MLDTHSQTSKPQSERLVLSNADLEILEQQVGMFEDWLHYLSGSDQHGACPKSLLPAHQSPVRGRLIRGANRSGKSTWAAKEIHWTCLGLHPFRATPELPVHVKIVCPTLPISMNEDHAQRDLIRKTIPEYQLRGHSWDSAWDGRVFTLTLENGSRIAFVSSEQAAATQQGTGGLGMLWIDEECPREHFAESIRAMVDTPRSFWLMTYWPRGKYPWVREYHDEVAAQKVADTRLFTCGIKDNEHNLPPGEIERFRSTMRPAEEKARLGGEYASDEDLVFGGLVIPVTDKDGKVIRTVSL